MATRPIAKVGVEGSNPFARSSFYRQLVGSSPLRREPDALPDWRETADQGERFRLCAEEDGVRCVEAQWRLSTLMHAGHPHLEQTFAILSLIGNETSAVAHPI